MTFNDFISRIEKDYTKKSDINSIKEYFEKLCNENPKLNDDFEKFKESVKNICGGGKKDFTIAFIKQVILENIMPDDNTTACIVRTGEHKGNYKISEIKNHDFFFTAISYPDSIKKAIQSGKFSMDATNKSIWVNFCSAFNKQYGLFNDWNKINEFLTKCCCNKKADNFLYARNLKNVCDYFTVLHCQSNQYSDKLYRNAIKAIKEVKDERSELRKKNEIITACATEDMQSNFIERINENMSEDEFISLIGEYANEFLDSDNFRNMTAIKNICIVFNPNDTYEDYSGYTDNVDKYIRVDRISDIYYPLFDELIIPDFKRIIRNCKQLCDNDLRVVFLNKILPDFKHIDDEEITAESYWNMLKLQNQEEQEEMGIAANASRPKDENKEVDKTNFAWLKYTRPILNHSVRYLGVIAAMMSVDEYNKNAGVAKAAINNFLNDCYLRELDENDMFDWFVIECINYEEEMYNDDNWSGAVSGLSTFKEYLSNGKLEIERTM